MVRWVWRKHGAEMPHFFRIRSFMVACLLLLPTLARGDSSTLDDSVEPLKSCSDWKIVSSAMEGIPTVSWSDGGRICDLASQSLDRPIPIGVFRALLKGASIINVRGGGDTEKIAYQLVELIEARGITEPKRMVETIDIAVRAFNGSNGRVTPKDLNVMVRQSGIGHTLSDDGLFNFAALISIRKRRNGE
jgi:hypothetical protein